MHQRLTAPAQHLLPWRSLLSLSLHGRPRICPRDPGLFSLVYSRFIRVDKKMPRGFIHEAFKAFFTHRQSCSRRVESLLRENCLASYCPVYPTGTVELAFATVALFDTMYCGTSVRVSVALPLV